MESNKDEEKQLDLAENTNEDKVITEKSEITLRTVKTSGKENTTSTSELKSVTETKTDGEVAQITLSTIHNIYKNNTDNSVSDTKEILLTRNNSSRKLNKAAYAKLHRKNSNPTHVGFLKNKYEDSSKKNNDDVNGNVKDNDGKKATIEKVDTNKNKETHKNSIEEKSKTKENSDKRLDDKNNLSGSTNSIEKATANIEKLQRNLTVKLNKETVEKLRSKYSPASFGYPKTFSVSPKKVQFASEASSATKIPVPKPRVSVKPSFKVSNKPQEITTKSTITETPKKELSSKDTTKANEKVLNEFVKPLKEETVEVTLVSPEKPEQIYASTSTLTSTAEESPKDVNSNEIKDTKESRDSILSVEYDEITFGEPESQHFIVRRSSSEDSVKKVEHFFNDEITMERKPKEKKRSSSFRRMLSGSFFGGSKKKNDDDKKKNKKIENADNAQNENNAFQRNSSQRHTISNYPSRDIPVKRNYVNGNGGDKNLDLEMRFAEMHINRFNQIKYNFNSGNESQLRHPQEDYVCMNNSEKKPSNYMNVSNINKYIDTSSSSSTLESEKPGNTYQNALIAQAELQQLRQNAKIRSNISNAPERCSETPPRAFNTCQNVQLVKPKALIPINSERPLPNPYHNGDHERNDKENNKTDKPKLDDVYGTVFDSIELRRNRSLSPQTRSIPKSPSLESTKLKLPPNRERIELQPRIKSPIPQTRVSTDKIIATELLKNARSPTPTRKNARISPSHQKLEIDIDYPDNIESVNKNETNVALKPPQSPKKVVEQHIEAAEWQKKQKEIDQYPFVPIQNNQIVTNAVVHNNHNKPPVQQQQKSPVQQQQKSPPNLLQPSRIPVSPSLQQMDRCVTPVNQRIPLSPAMSPEKLEMRQSVEAWHWKELKKLKEQKEREEKELYYYQLQMSSYGYAEDPILTRRSRSVSPSMPRGGGGRRSLSLPREMRNQKLPVAYPSPENVEGYVRLRQPEPIPEGRAVMNPNMLYQTRPEYYYGQVNQNFIRNSPQRRTIGVINTQDLNQRPPIFKRGSLTQPQPEPLYQANKKVSFSSHQNNQSVWPTKNGFTQSPPQRRIEKRDSTLEDEVFLPNSPKLDNVPKREPAYGYLPPKTNAVHSQENFLRKHQNSEMVNDSPYGSTRQINQQIRQQMIQQNPVYYSKQSLPDGPQNKTVSVSNKVCDFYGQIHDANAASYGNIQKTGVVYGQLQRNPVPSSPVVLRQNVPNCFVRGSRLTASANDMYKRYTPVDPRYRSDTVVFEPIYERRYRYDVPNRPLPPIPNERTSSLLQKNRFVPASDTESDTSEIQRIFRLDVHVNNRNYNGK